MTAYEKFEKYGEVARYSTEQFNRYKGTEYRFFMLKDGSVLGFVRGYPDECPSYAHFAYAHFTSVEMFCTAFSWSRNIWAVTNAHAISEEQYIAQEKNEITLDKCPECKRHFVKVS